jgi:hypothetical protein
MNMTGPLRKFVLTTHVICSVGWFGAVAGFLALALSALADPYDQKARAAYLAMDLITRFVIVPLCIASLLTGILESLGTTWGLFRHYWVLFKLLLTLVATVLLLVHTQPIRYAASIAAEPASSGGDLRNVGIQLVADAGAAFVLLLVATTLGVYKPRGMTAYGLRKQSKGASLERGPAPADAA